ncbi:F0F1 ATP synthase subunit gamma [Ostreibacterium oceani]|uniref:ATP synthase gamma chain n=1 Tax=Ostreibacterium oceani TaxID=2654998 RepID=A0A6N7EVT9_9GAMM|nr:F0F1 ATP synthase subunit gamma [Ostreibacterium oceani]MPV86612.1 F0F1 ATP synthase subunit gamma [Ostreibacterium oceani]
MSNAKEIRTQISSIQNTKKITKAMEMVAASKMRKAQMYMEQSRPYADKIRSVAAGLANANTEIEHPFLIKNEKKKVGYIVVTTDRGLCGGLNINLFKKLIASAKAHHEEGCEVSLAVYGTKGYKFLSYMGFNIIANKEKISDQPSLNELLGPVTVMIDLYRAGELDRLYMVSNKFVNTMTQAPEISQLLPVPAFEADALPEHAWDYIYEPSAEALLEKVLVRYVEALLKCAVSENAACEMAARMIAMKNATDNAGSLIKEKQLQYNKARQAAITQELSEIVAGAAAV